ncbi:MAG: ABC transporter permease subunit [Candidatus Heimdallarchaeaceae archaeon]
MAKEKNSTKESSKKSIIDILYVKLLKDPSTNFIISVVAIIFIIWMVIPLLLVLSGAVYIKGEEPQNYYFSDSLNAEQPTNNTWYQLFSVSNNTAKIKIILETPKRADFDLSVWDPNLRRTGGVTNTSDTVELNIPNSDYSGNNKKTETITIGSPLLNGTWAVSCFAVSGEGKFKITVNIKSTEKGFFTFQAIHDVFTGVEYFNVPGDNTTSIYQKTIEDWGGPSDSVAIKDDLAFVAERDEGIEVLNISNPYSITEITQYYETSSSFIDFVIKDDLLYCAASKQGLVIFNISTVATKFQPVFELPGFANVTTGFIEMDKNLIYLGVDYKQISIIDVADPYNPIIRANITVEAGIDNVAIHDDYLYAVGYSTGILVYNVSNPNNPELIRAYTDEDFPSLSYLNTFDIKIEDIYAYIGTSSGLQVFDISDPQNISLEGTYANYKVRGVEISGNLAFLRTEKLVGALLNYAVEVVSIADVTSITNISEYVSIDAQFIDLEVDTANDLLYVAHSKAGFYVIDISDIFNLKVVGTYEDTFYITVHTFSGVNHGVVLNTIFLGFFTTLFSIILGTSLAFMLARYEFPGKRLVSLLALAPLIIPPFISGMGFRLLLGPSGLINNLFLVPVFQTKIVLSGFIAICFVQTSHFYALIYLNAFSSFINIDPSMEESAENLGASSLKLFFTVTLPLALPGIGAGSILVLILSMEDVGTPIIFAGMGDNGAKYFLTYYVFENIQRAGSAVDPPDVMVLGGILLFVALIGFFAIRKYISLRKYAMVSKGRAGEYRMSKAKWKLLFIYPFLIVLFTFSLLVHVGVFMMSILKTLGPRSVNDIRFTTENYKLIFVSSRYNIPNYAINTVVYSVIATILIIIIGTVAAYVISRKEFKGKKLMDALITLPIAIPGIVLALGYYRVFNWSGIAARNPNWFTNMMAKLTSSLRLDPFVTVAATLLIMSYTIRKIPFTVRSAYAGLQQTDVVLEEASFNLGASRAKTFAKITIPLISLNVFAGSLVSFLYCLSEVSTTIFLIFQASSGTLTWYMAWNPLQFQIFCALGVILMLLQIFSLFVTNVILGSRAEAMTGI